MQVYFVIGQKEVNNRWLYDSKKEEEGFWKMDRENAKREKEKVYIEIEKFCW